MMYCEISIDIMHVGCSWNHLMVLYMEDVSSFITELAKNHGAVRRYEFSQDVVYYISEHMPLSLMDCELPKHRCVPRICKRCENWIMLKESIVSGFKYLHCFL